MSDISTYEEYLEEYGTLTYTNVGVSMIPLLRQGKDLFTVRKKENARCARGDVILYRRKPDSYVLHRVVEVRPDDYVVLGDNCVEKEYGITDSDILGVMTGFTRSGKDYSVDDLSYRIYTFLTLNTQGLRIAAKKTASRLRRLAKKVIGK